MGECGGCKAVSEGLAMHAKRIFWILSLSMVVAIPSFGQPAVTPDPQTANISGTVTDAENDIVPGAKVVLDASGSGEIRTVLSSDNGAFAFENVPAGNTYHITITAAGFADWTSPSLAVQPGQFLLVSNVRLVLAGGVTSVTVYASSEQLATEQVHLEEKQRVLGVIPNFWVVYDPNAAPLTARLKFRLALRTSLDPVTFLGAALVSGMDQAGDTPDFQQGAKGYGQRLGANYTTGVTDVMLGGAILPSLLHQDPRYFYQGTGTTGSRLLHALSSPFICKGDNGRWQPNFSSVGGDLATGAISQTWFPDTDRDSGLVFENVLITTGGRMANGVIQEFVLRRFTSGAGSRDH